MDASARRFRRRTTRLHFSDCDCTEQTAPPCLKCAYWVKREGRWRRLRTPAMGAALLAPVLFAQLMRLHQRGAIADGARPSSDGTAPRGRRYWHGSPEAIWAGEWYGFPDRNGSSAVRLAAARLTTALCLVCRHASLAETVDFGDDWRPRQHRRAARPQPAAAMVRTLMVRGVTEDWSMRTWGSVSPPVHQYGSVIVRDHPRTTSAVSGAGTAGPWRA
jgi:hypothetical protein